MPLSAAPSKTASMMVVAAFAAALTGSTTAEAKPSAGKVNSTVARVFNHQYDEDGKATCRSTGSASWSCQIRTETDRLNLANFVAGGSDSGTTYANAKANWYSYSCTARYSGGKISVGAFKDHHYDS